MSDEIDAFDRGLSVAGAYNFRRLGMTIAMALGCFRFYWNHPRLQGGPPVIRRARAGADRLVRCRERKKS